MAKKKTTKNTPKEIRQVGVFLESMDKKIDFLVEGHKTHSKRFDKVENDIKEFKEEIDYKFNVVFD